MKHPYHRIFSAVLAVLLLVLLVPPASAAEPDPATGEPEAASNTVTITAKNDFYIGYTEFYYHQYVGGDYYPVGPYFTENAAYYSMENGGYAFCVQPSKHGETGEHIQTEWNKYIDTEAMIGIGRALCYGAPNNGDTSEDALEATTLLIWDIATGYRNADGTARSRDAIGAISPPFYKAASGSVKVKYNQILDKMKNHNKIPSFAAPAEEQLTDSNRILLQFNIDTGLYEASVTDTNEILADYNYTSNIPGLVFTRDENTLKISATQAAAAQIGGGKNFFARGHYYEVTDKTALVWSNAANENSQQLTTLPAVIDPVPAYIRVTTPTGSLSIVKTTEDGKNLSGWQFSLYSDEACTKLLSGPYSSNADGKILIPGLAAGTVWVKEIGHVDAAINALYKCDSKNPQKVILTPGQTAQVSFHNRLNAGQVKLIKTTNTGSNVSGWKIGLYYDAACTRPVPGSPFTTGTDGSVTVPNLAPGTLYAKEEPVSDPYWLCDNQIKEITVVSGAVAEVTFHNTHRGIIKIVKAMDMNGPLEGWVFKVTDSAGQKIEGSPFTSQADGTIFTGALMPGEYTVEELLPEDSLYRCLSTNPQTVSVKPGETAEVVFINTIRSGSLAVLKTDTSGAPLAGAKFLLEWSEDGSSWQPVSFSDSEPVTKGSCMSVGLVDGCLTTGDTGLVTFTGLHPECHYRVTEVTAPNGYQLAVAPVFEGKLSVEEDLSVTVTAADGKVFILPFTGVYDLPILALCWSFCIIAIGCSWICLRRKER